MGKNEEKELPEFLSGKTAAKLDGVSREFLPLWEAIQKLPPEIRNSLRNLIVSIPLLGLSSSRFMDQLNQESIDIIYFIFLGLSSTIFGGVILRELLQISSYVSNGYQKSQKNTNKD